MNKLFPTLLAAALLPLAVATALAVTPVTPPKGDPAEAAPATVSVAAQQRAFAEKIDKILAGAHRSDANRARDAFRHPKQTLDFFGLKEGQTVIEITPGGGWYTEILAPALKGNGTLIAALVDPASASSDGAKKYYTTNNQKYREKLAAAPDIYGGTKTVEFNLQQPTIGPDGSADLVLTFRNVHNWTMAKSDAAMFKAFYAALKPGGVLGLVEHRAKAGTDAAGSAKSGYMVTEYVTKLATDAGFKLEAASEVNSNPKDTKDYEHGVWTLPPTLTDGEKDKDKYLAIGESDRMTLRFVKPAAAASH